MRLSTKKKRVAMVIGRFLVRCFFVLSFFSNTSLWAVAYGSETAVSILPAVTFPAVDNDNAMLGFGWFKNGITLEDSSTTCTFNSVYPVAGTLALNGGSLYLQEDFVVTNTASIVGGATIIGNNHMVQLSSTVTSLSATYTFRDTLLALGSNLELTGQLVFEGDCCLAGKLYHIDLNGGSILIASDSRLVFDDMCLMNVAGSNVACADDSAQIVFHDVQWHQMDDFIFDAGSIEFTHAVDFMGASTFWYDSSQTSTITSDACWTITNDMTLKVGRKNAVDYVEPFYFVDETSTIKLDNCSLLVTGSGIGLFRGKFELDRDVTVDVLSSCTMNGLIIGTGQEGGDFSMKLNSGAAIKLLAGWWVYNNTHSTGRMHALSPASRCIRYADSQFCVQKDWTIPPMIFQVASGMPVSILEPGVNFRYDKTSLITSMGSMNVTGGEKAPGFLLTGNDDLYLNDGVEPMPIYVSGKGNRLHGNGNIIAPIILQDKDTDLRCQLNGVINEDVVLNGGTLLLDGDLDLGLDVTLTGSGIVDLSTQSFKFGIKIDYWDSAIEWAGDYGIVQLNADVNLVGTWTFTNNCTLEGNGSTLDLAGGGRLIIADGTHLVIQDVTLKGIAAGSIQCLSDNSSFELKNVIWEQKGDFTLNAGSIKFSGENSIQGAYNFIYDSSQTTTIDAHSRVALSNNMALYIGRKKLVDYVEPLYFVDDTSVLQLNNCSFIVTASGMRLTRGKVVVNGDVSFETLAPDSDHGLELGDGQEEHDVIYQFDAGGALKFKRGWLVYNCYAPDCFIASSENAKIVRSAAAATLIKQPWTFPRMGLRIESGVPETVADGGVITYDHSHVTFSGVEFDIFGQLLGSIQFCLAGNHSLYPTKGTFPCYLYIDGVDNQLLGTGDITGPIIFQNYNAELSCGLNGTIFFGPVLNNGKLILINDLWLGPNIGLTTGGQIDLSYYRCYLSSLPSTWSQPVAWSGMGGAINLRADLDLVNTWSFANNCVIDGGQCILTLKPGGNLVVQDNTSLIIKNATIKGVSSENIRCLTNNSRLILDNVFLEQEGDFHFSMGSIKTLNDVDFAGSYSFVYDSPCTSTIGIGSHWAMKSGLVFEVGRNNGNEPLSFESKSTSVLNLQDCSLKVTDSGMRLAAGHLTVDGNVMVDSSSTSTSVGLIFGTGFAGSDMISTLNSGASVQFRSGWLVYDNVSPSTFFATSKNARVIRYGNSKTYINNNWIFPELTLVVFSGQPSTVVGDEKILTYDNVHLIFENAEFDFTGYQFGDSLFALDGNGSLFLTKGIYQPYLSVTGTGNMLRGCGDIAGPVVFTDPSAQLLCNLNGSILYDIALGGGTIILENDFYLGPQNTLSQTGTVNLSGYRCVLGTEDQLWTSTMAWQDGSISLNSHVTLHGTWTFEDSCVVNGGGNVLDLDGTGNIVVADGATVTLRDIRVRGISGDQIKCLGSSSTLILDDVIWEQDGDYVFTQGKMQWVHDVRMKGASTFAYQTGQMSTILSESNLNLDSGFIFKYDPAIIASKDLIAFEDFSSSLVLDSATLSATVTGLTLKKGRVYIKGDSFFKAEQAIENDTVIIDEGICLGNGDAAQDMLCEIASGATLHITQGSLIYNNYLPDLLNMVNSASRLCLHAGARLRVQETMDLGVGGLYLSNRAEIDIKPDKELLGSVFTAE